MLVNRAAHAALAGQHGRYQEWANTMPATDFLIVLNLSVISIPMHVHCILYADFYVNVSRTCWCYTSCMGSRCDGQSLPPRSTGQWLDTFLGFAPICFAPLCFVPPLFFSLLVPPSPWVASSPPHIRRTGSTSFVRSCYSWREHPAVSETSMRDSSSFLHSPLSPLWHLFPPHHLSPAYSFAELVPPLFLGHVFPWPTGIFPPAAFPLVRTNDNVRDSHAAITVLQWCMCKSVESAYYLDCGFLCIYLRKFLEWNIFKEI